ncbi:MAG: Dabb family protein [Anaerovoracaceae bacterium]|jgi:hypothetical protein
MVRHIVMWKFRDDVPEETRAGLRAELPDLFGSLVGKVPGLLKVEFVSYPLGSSTHDMALITEHDSIDSKNAYADHPAHLEVANNKVRPFTTERAALDYEI